MRLLNLHMLGSDWDLFEDVIEQHTQSLLTLNRTHTDAASSSSDALRESPVLLRGFVSLMPGGRPRRFVTVHRSHAASIESTPGGPSC